MKVKLDHPALFVKGIEIISELVTEVKIKLNEFGLSISAIDPANVAMVGFKIPKSAFSEFEVGNEELGINLDNLKKILKRCGNGSVLTLESSENVLNILIQDRLKRNFSLNLIEIEGEDIDFASKVSRMEFVARIELNSIDFTASIEDCAVVGDSCAFKIENGKYVIEAKALNSARTEFSGDEAVIEAEECKSKYSLEYLQKFLKGAKICDKTNVAFAEDHPLKLEFRMPKMEIAFILAPRVETD